MYSDQDIHIIATVAEQATLAVSNILLVESLRGLAQQLVRTDEEQRKRLASDLHDTVLQDLFYLKQHIYKTSQNPSLKEHLEDSIHRLRQMIWSQRPPMLSQGLPLALEGLVGEMQKVTDQTSLITWECHVNDLVGLNDEQATCIFRVAQEALNNAIKHSHAQQLQLLLDQNENGWLRLVVRDNGTGLPLNDQGNNIDNNHFGLALMYERAMMIGAELHLQSHPGMGTAVILDVRL